MLIPALALVALSGLNRWWSGSWLYPATIYSTVWAFALTMLWLTASWFYPVQSKTIELFLLGALSFSFGSFLVSLLRMRPIVRPTLCPRRRKHVELVLDVGLFLALACLPSYILYLRQIAGGSLFSADAWHAIRRSVIELQNMPGGAPFRPEQSLTPIFVILALLAAYEYDGTMHRRLRTWTFVAVAVVFEVLSSARSGLFLLLLGVVAVIALKRRNFPLISGSLVLSLFSFIFIANQIALEKMGTRADASFQENLPMLTEGIAAYGLGGLVGFDVVVQNPKAIENGWTLDKFFLRTANKFGANVDEPSRYLEYTPISPYLTGNVYSIYFPFFAEYGVVGVLFLPCLLGSIVTFAYRAALRGNRTGVLLYCLGLYGTFMSPFAESFFGETGFWIKALVICTVIYAAPAFLAPRSYALSSVRSRRPAVC